MTGIGARKEGREVGLESVVLDTIKAETEIGAGVGIEAGRTTSATNRAGQDVFNTTCESISIMLKGNLKTILCSVDETVADVMQTLHR